MLLLLAICPVGLIAQNPLDAVTESFEREQMTRLAAQQKRPGIHIAAFRSDGCSGGMSQSWGFLADTLPKFADYAGTQPPWEHCCVAHDRDYWQGETKNGFNKREQSDAQLRTCVNATGEQRGAEIAQTLSLPQQARLARMLGLAGTGKPDLDITVQAAKCPFESLRATHPAARSPIEEEKIHASLRTQWA